MKHITKKILAGVLSLVALNTIAEQVIFGPTTSDGDYTLSWNQACSSPNWFELRENSTTYQLGCASSKSFTDKPEGTYVYELYHCELDVVIGLLCVGGPYMGWDAHSVTVAAPPPDTPSGITGPSSDTDGAYSLSWGSVADANSYQLQEQLNGGAFSTIQNTSSTG